jgi:hypothetical protein
MRKVEGIDIYRQKMESADEHPSLWRRIPPLHSLGISDKWEIDISTSSFSVVALLSLSYTILLPFFYSILLSSGFSLPRTFDFAFAQILAR